jgi:protein-S-isoprenylcysteine O-methyltransferase Ste14
VPNIEPSVAIYVPWVVWALSWTLAAAWTDRTVAGAGVARQALYRIFTTGGFLLLLFAIVDGGQAPMGMTGLGLDFLYRRLWILPTEAQWAMVGLATLGFVFCWWARFHLGRLWSGRITRKEGHHVVDTGPYGLVRHPIYTGILFAALATMALKGTVHAIIGTVLLVIGYWMKARIEERFLREQLGAADYDAYAKRVPMLVPFAPA